MIKQLREAVPTAFDPLVLQQVGESREDHQCIYNRGTLIHLRAPKLVQCFFLSAFSPSQKESNY